MSWINRDDLIEWLHAEEDEMLEIDNRREAHEASYIRKHVREMPGMDVSQVMQELKALPSAQPYTEAESQKIQELEQAELGKAFELGKAEANKWIPCDKGEPDEDTECWVTVKTTDALYRGNFTKRYGERRDKGFITSGGFMWWNTAIAWMPIYEPDPYRAEGDDNHEG